MSKFENQQILIEAAGELALLTELYEGDAQRLHTPNGKAEIKRIKDKLLEYYEIKP